MEQKPNRKKKFLFPKVFGAKDSHSTNFSNSTESPERSSVASPSASSSSFFKSLSDSRSLKFSGFSSPATSSRHTEAFSERARADRGGAGAVIRGREPRRF